MSSQRGVTDDRREQIAREKAAVIPVVKSKAEIRPSVAKTTPTAKGIVNGSGVHSDHIAQDKIKAIGLLKWLQAIGTS
jgi:hypothetical protein